jgi:hypothetical protein
MIKTYDGSSYKRVGGKPGDRSPATGFTRMRVVYTATGGETSINLSALNSQFSYQPGNAHLDVKRSSGGSLIAGVDFYETSPSTIGFPATDALAAGEIIEVTRQYAVTGIQALPARPDGYQAVATAGQTLITANFSFPYNMNPCGVRVYLHGIRLARNIDFFEVNLGSGNTNQITLADATVGGENILMEPTYAPIDQTAAATTFNSTQLSNIQSAMTAGTQGFVDQSNLISVPATAIVNRAKIPDLANDLRPSMGVERIMTQSIYQLQNEFGPNGETVSAAVNDDRGLIRFVGSWILDNTGAGSGQSSQLSTDYAEITFFGTALNILVRSYSYAPDARVSVDGGAEGSNIFGGVTLSSVLNSRNYAAQTVLPIASGLTLGLHTVKIRANGNLQIQGFEVINASASINVNPGSGYINGQKYSSLAAQSLSYNSGFESGTLGTRGGHVVVYQKADGTIGKAVQPVNASTAFLASADHTNEEVARTYNWREFGAGRSDDFSGNINTGNYAFVLDDGTTSLIGSSIAQTTVSNTSLFVINASGGFFTFSFVGTGLDLIRIDQNNTTIDQSTVYVDGVSVGTLTGAASTQARRQKIVSGLPYGTHTVKITRDAAAAVTLGISQFVTYQPKKPIVPPGAIELADYNIMANYVTTSNSAGSNGGYVSQGTLRKNIVMREATYTGTWNIGGSVNATYDAGNSIFSSTSGSSVQYTFVGTGFDFRHITAASYGSLNVSINGTALNSSFPNASSITVGTYGNGTYGGKAANTSGLLNAISNNTLTTSGATTYGSGLFVTGLSLGVYTVSITKADAANTEIQFFDIITPVHSAKSALYADIQNTLSVGSCAMSDNRKTTMIKDSLPAQKAWAQAVGVISSPTTGSGTAVPCPDLSCVVKTKSGAIKVSYNVQVTNSVSTASVGCQVYIDGMPYGTIRYGTSPSANIGSNSSDSFLVPVSDGFHKVDIYWLVDTGTGTALGTRRNLVVEEK